MFFTICLVTKGGGGIMKKVSNDDIGGKVVYNLAFSGDVVFESPS